MAQIARPVAQHGGPEVGQIRPVAVRRRYSIQTGNAFSEVDDPVYGPALYRQMLKYPAPGPDFRAVRDLLEH